MLVEPVDMLLTWLDELQSGQASLARLVGVHEIPDPEVDWETEPGSEEIEARDVRFAYREGRDVLHGVDLDVAPGTRIAVVGPSGAGKSTLGRLLAGIHGPRTGRVDHGRRRASSAAGRDGAQHVALVTQEHHVFVGSLRDNLRLARPRRRRRASCSTRCAPSTPRSWATRCPTGSTPRSAPAARS